MTARVKPGRIPKAPTHEGRTGYKPSAEWDVETDEAGKVVSVESHRAKYYRVVKSLNFREEELGSEFS